MLVKDSNYVGICYIRLLSKLREWPVPGVWASTQKYFWPYILSASINLGLTDSKSASPC